jgi:hypothetical protein
MGVKAIKPSVSALFSAKRLSMKGDRCMHGQPSTSSLAGRTSSFSPCKIYGFVVYVNLASYIVNFNLFRPSIEFLVVDY